MKHEFAGWVMLMADNTYHGVVCLDGKGYGLACNHKAKVDRVEGALPSDIKLCGKCEKIVPTFACIEYMSGFAVRHTRTGQQHWMSDGVDVIFDKNEKAMSPGHKDFRAKWEEFLNESRSETMEAYFPDLYASEE